MSENVFLPVDNKSITQHVDLFCTFSPLHPFSFSHRESISEASEASCHLIMCLENQRTLSCSSPPPFFGCFFPQEVSFKGFWLSDLNVSLEPNICIVLAWLPDNPGKRGGKVQIRDTALRTVWVPFSKSEIC